MPFSRETNETKTGIEDLEIVLFDPGPGNNETQSGIISYQILLSNNSTELRKTDLFDRLDEDAAGRIHQANLISLATYLRTRLIAEGLP